jgi:hypothetical protein
MQETAARVHAQHNTAAQPETYAYARTSRPDALSSERVRHHELVFVVKRHQLVQVLGLVRTHQLTDVARVEQRLRVHDIVACGMVVG